MKLYKVYINNGLEYEDETHDTFWTVSNSLDVIYDKIKEDFYFMDEDKVDLFKNGIETNYPVKIVITEINELDGYKIKLIKK